MAPYVASFSGPPTLVLLDYAVAQTVESWVGMGLISPYVHCETANKICMHEFELISYENMKWHRKKNNFEEKVICYQL